MRKVSTSNGTGDFIMIVLIVIVPVGVILYMGLQYDGDAEEQTLLLLSDDSQKEAEFLCFEGCNYLKLKYLHNTYNQNGIDDCFCSNQSQSIQIY